MIAPEILAMIEAHAGSSSCSPCLRDATLALVDFFRKATTPAAILDELESHRRKVEDISAKAVGLAALEEQAVALVWAFDAAEQIGHGIDCPGLLPEMQGDLDVASSVCDCGWSKLAGAVDALADTLGINDPSPDALGEGCLGVLTVTDLDGKTATFPVSSATMSVENDCGDTGIPLEGAIFPDDGSGGAILHCEHGRQFNWACKPCGRGTP